MTLRQTFMLALLLLGWSGSGSAHNRGLSYSEWTLTPAGAEVRVRVSQLELSRLTLDPQRTPDYLARTAQTLGAALQLWSGELPCTASPAMASAAADGWVAASWTLHCAEPGPRVIRSRLFLDVAPAHLHFLRVALPQGRVIERVLTYAEPSFALDAPPSAPSSFAHYLGLGVEHILSGWDHLAFVLALILLAASLREVALVVTGFTLAHSLTLAAAVTGMVQVQALAIEALIGFSIALVAAENLWLRAGRERWVPGALAGALALLAVSGLTLLSWNLLLGLALFTVCYFALAARSARPLRLRIAIAFVFGLVHGFGFAGALAELHLPAPQLALGLLGFNSGVELGQLLVIGAVWPALQLLGKRPAARRWAGDLASMAIVALGSFWFVTRAFA